MDFRQLLRESLVEHYQHLIDEFWGTAGAGILAFAQDTKKFLVSLRSPDVDEGGTWGIIGGAIAGVGDEEDAPSPADGAAKEFCEETGFCGSFKQLIPVFVFKKKKFTYYNFIGVVDKQFKSNLGNARDAWESSRLEWLSLEQLIKLPQKHFGLKNLLADPETMEVLKQLSSKKI